MDGLCLVCYIHWIPILSQFWTSNSSIWALSRLRLEVSGPTRCLALFLMAEFMCARLLEREGGNIPSPEIWLKGTLIFMSRTEVTLSFCYTQTVISRHPVKPILLIQALF